MKRDQIIAPGEYAAIPKWVLALPEWFIPAQSKLILAVLIERLGKNDTCWPGKATIERDTGLPRSTTQKYLDYLEDIRWIKIERRKRGDGGDLNDTNEYTINLPPFDTAIEATVAWVKAEPRPRRSRLLASFLASYSRPQRSRPLGHSVADIGHSVAHPSATAWPTPRPQRGPELPKTTTEVGTTEGTTELEPHNRCASTASQIIPPSAIERQVGLAVVSDSLNRNPEGQTMPNPQIIKTSPGSAAEGEQFAPAVITIHQIFPRLSYQAIKRTLDALVTEHGFTLQNQTARKLSAIHRNRPLKLEEVFVPVTIHGRTIPGWRHIIDSDSHQRSEADAEAPARFLIEAWKTAGLNGIANEDRLAAGIAAAAGALSRRLGPEAYQELVLGALANKTAQDFRLSSPATNSVEWFLRTKDEGGAPITNLERCSRGDFNWSDSKADTRSADERFGGEMYHHAEE